jgi:NAD(P)-dependent dehydrogenase (short-subunit alcohol dehydrogenase family)
MQNWLITGCSSGIGRALARAVLARGWCATITARNPRELENIAADNEGQRCLIQKLDVTDAKEIQDLLAIDRPALPRRRGKAGISGDLSAVIEVSGESFRPEDRSELRPMPWTPSNIGGGADALVCSALSSASRSASTALICSRSNSSRSSSRQTWALRCWGKRRPSPV